ncbi:ribosomal protein S18-alanine N-acetyltransferase [Desulfofundulus thermosubterraneus]|uniref:Ribosomal-protein-alanine N-acetyltransferase n=1 Tax=Desulfofundulus thermosubterraneus DSM 16057 TaxID=1121432 RepID=A0A1M6JM98_9FIRM|nr:ribosomal protein S18-alanine N-acetyltransferase [Desulfofundulus thermosubterraneus]SHJ47817.1 ribosomal-protein-alanine N-acetyltransferase [Desulfofundulus thermosubterraneus DSM 16057]
MSMELTFTEMSCEHLDEVMAIEQASFPTPWSRYAFTYELLQNEFAVYIVVLVGQKVVGYAGMWLILDEAHVTNVAVHPQYRRRHIGRKLMQELMRRAVTLGASRMTLEVRTSNHVARRLYTSLGFVERGRRRGYYTDTNEDAVIMWKDPLDGFIGQEVSIDES